MRQANEYGVYPAEITEELARRGRAFAAVELCQCADGLYRFALDFHYSHGGFCGPISDHGAGFDSAAAAKEAATRELLRRLPKPHAGEPHSVHEELRELRAMVEAAFCQPSLF